MNYFKLPAGVRDILPEESARLDKIEDTLRKKFAQNGLSLGAHGGAGILRHVRLHPKPRAAGKYV